MAVLSNSRRGAAGIALIVAGALFLLAAILPLLGASLPILLTLAQVAMAVGLGILALGAVNSVIAKIALLAAAVGWAILALASLGIIAIPAGIVTFAAIIAAIGGIVGAIVLYTGKEIRNRPAIAFIIAMVLGALYLLGVAGILSLGQLSPFVLILFGAALVVTGVLFRRTEGRRR